MHISRKKTVILSNYCLSNVFKLNVFAQDDKTNQNIFKTDNIIERNSCFVVTDTVAVQWPQENSEFFQDLQAAGNELLSLFAKAHTTRYETCKGMLKNEQQGKPRER